MKVREFIERLEEYDVDQEGDVGVVLGNNLIVEPEVVVFKDFVVIQPK